MKLVPVKCPNCGASMEVNEDTTTCACPACGSNIVIEDGPVTKTIERTEIADEAKIEHEKGVHDYKMKALEFEIMKLKFRIQPKWIIIGSIALVAIMFVGIYFLGRNSGEKSVEPANAGAVITVPGRGNIQDDDELIGERVEALDCVVVQENINNIGELVTAEYQITAVESFEEHSELWGFSLPGTTTEFIYSYTSMIYAGVNLSNATVECDEDSKVITISIPEASILSVDIDTDSFEVYYEDSGLFTDLTLEDVGTSMDDYRDRITASAEESGLLDRASENAENMVYSVITGLVDQSIYTVKVQVVDFTK